MSDKTKQMSENHYSDCAVHNAPALPVGTCDCAELRVGDEVEHINGSWTDPNTIKRIETVGQDTLAFFAEGGFWRVSQLRKVLR